MALLVGLELFLNFHAGCDEQEISCDRPVKWSRGISCHAHELELALDKNQIIENAFQICKSQIGCV